MLTPDPHLESKLPARSYGRRLILVDIENVLGTAIFTSEDVVLAQNLIEGVIGSVAGEQVIIGVSHMGVFSVHGAWHRVRMLVRSGPDGADLELLSELRHDDIQARFKEIVLVSGDGIFTDALVGLTAQGIHVTVVAPLDGCSKRLELAANTTLKFDRMMTQGDAA